MQMVKRMLEKLRATGIPFAETAWKKAPGGSYGVIDLDGQADAVWADNSMKAQAIEGTVDLFTRGSGEATAKSVQKALNECGVSWQLNSIQYEEDTGLRHFEWVWQTESW
jgi:hypothetical protein